MNKDLFAAYKPTGISPYDLIKNLKYKHPKLRNKKIAYAGRLDPMAEGVVLLIKGKELKNFHNHLKYDKKYKAEIIFGFSTDSYDVLGIPEYNKLTKTSRKKVEENLEKFKGVYEFEIPPFSSYKIDGKPLFKWAREGNLDQIKIPKKKVDVYDIVVNNVTKINKYDLKKEINHKIENVIGDFRQEEILKKWNKLLAKRDIKNEFSTVSITISCASGCYIRSIANELGQLLNINSFLFHLTRTEVGEWGIKKAINP